MTPQDRDGEAWTAGRITPKQAEHWVRQARVKFRIIRDREFRAYMAGRADYLEGDLLNRSTVDAVRSAYAAGFREALRLAREGRA